MIKQNVVAIIIIRLWQKQQMRKEVWVTDTSNKKFRQIKQKFQAILEEEAKDSRVNYYDFLLAAKKLIFRFQQSSHLMALKNFFNKNKNSVLVKKLVNVLSVSQECLNTKDDKIIVKFNVPDNSFAPIQEATNEDQEQYDEATQTKLKKYNSEQQMDHEQEINEKIMIILSIKLEQMQKKLKYLTDPFLYPNVLNVFDEEASFQINYEKFKKGILRVIFEIKDKIKISQEDIKAIFSILDTNNKGEIELQDIQRLERLQELNQPMKQFYESRINKNMVKNTLFKLGKVNNSSIQIYQLKNASILEFQQIQNSIVNQPSHKGLPKKKMPHFGPLKSNINIKKNDKHLPDSRYNHHPHKGALIDKQREKIQKILRNSKETKRKPNDGSTVASKLRSLFVHKVILPRQKMLEEEQEKYKQNKNPNYNLSIRPLKEPR